MPERNVSPDHLRTGLWLLGLFLAGWASLAALLTAPANSLVGTAAQTLGAPHWLFSAALACVAVPQVIGHTLRCSRVVITGDILGGTVCAGAASVLGGGAAIAALNWGTIAAIFLLHAVMLSQRQTS